MIYLSQLLGKKIYFNKKIFGEMVDFAVFENFPTPSISKIVVKKGGKKITISPSFLSIKQKKAVLTSDKAPQLPFDARDFYLNEDLLDKQVIDIDDKRLVRVNDVLIDSNGELKVVGIDIGIGGILRRLGLERLIKTTPKILPWQMIEAFDYQTGTIKISLSQNKLNSMHPSEIADILEELGTKERKGMVQSLEAETAAEAIEETSFRTREAILEELPTNVLRTIVTKMHAADIAGLFYKLTPLRIREILKFMGTERAQRVERLLDFGNHQAGRVMRTTFWNFDGGTTVKQAYNDIFRTVPKPEAIIVTNGNQKIVGTIYVKDMLDTDSLALLKDIVSERKFVYAQSDFNQIVSLFARYNLRVLPVVDKDKKPIGVITAGIVLAKIEESTKENELV